MSFKVIFGLGLAFVGRLVRRISAPEHVDQVDGAAEGGVFDALIMKEIEAVGLRGSSMWAFSLGQRESHARARIASYGSFNRSRAAKIAVSVSPEKRGRNSRRLPIVLRIELQESFGLMLEVAEAGGRGQG